ncbi:MAG: DUF3179 domain-containing protein [Verrucomicrobia bacterium]|nr:DUF3179 domain-containing protein [Verrucomicrobiota bacterium]MBI3867289.1 DUF3179 domain-containing protein [Verrucomicrobiota bacterium]
MLLSLFLFPALVGTSPGAEPTQVLRPGLFKQLTEPPCSYCSTEHRKGFIRQDDRVVAWIRGAHNGGAISIRHFLAAPRVINDTYGLFFYDPDGGYVSAFKKDKGYEFHGWRHGVMMVKGPDGTLWSGLSGAAFEGPKKGQRLERLPSLVTDWGHWLMLHPESTAYDLFDGKRYPSADLPGEIRAEALESMGEPDSRLNRDAVVLGVEVGEHARAYPLDVNVARACVLDAPGGEPVAVFWYGPTRSAVAFKRRIDGRLLTFEADSGSPETAPFKDRETGTRWTLAGRGVDGLLRGRELEWVNSVQCPWRAWAAEYPATTVYDPKK